MKMKVTNNETGEIKIYGIGENTYTPSRGREYYLLDELNRPVRVCRYISPEYPHIVQINGETLELIRD